MLVRVVGHRTLTHCFLGVAIFAVLVSPLAPLVPGLYAALLAGYVSHLIADALNTPGVPLLWPLKWRFRLLPGGMRSGGAAEFVVALAVAAAAVYGVYELHPALSDALSF